MIVSPLMAMEGCLFDGDMSIAKLHVFWKAYIEKMKELNIIDNFVRYHPVLANAIRR